MENQEVTKESPIETALAKEKAEKAAAQKAAKAPDKEKMKKEIEGLVLNIPMLTSNEGVLVLENITNRFAGFKKWALEQIETL